MTDHGGRGQVLLVERSTGSGHQPIASTSPTASSTRSVTTPTSGMPKLFGSHTSAEPDGHPADELSDIDIRVTVNGGADREFFEGVDPILAHPGKALLSNVFVSDRSYTRSLMFATYSPFPESRPRV
ncbi:MAG: hypothetical protein QOF07_2731 [Bradyrhizobium sp.]|nr:hypothetical protein [Bradyrhizobium sp.]